MLPVQDNPSPLNPALHKQVKEPMVFWQTALASQGEERHSSISVKYKSLRLNKKKKNIYNNNKGPLGLPFLNFYQTDPRLAGSRRQHNSVSDEETLFDPPSVRSWLLLPWNAQYDVSPLVPHLQDVLCPFVGGRILLQCSPVVGTGAVVGTANWIRCNKNPNVCQFSNYHWNSGVYYVQPHIGFPVQFHHNNKSCRQDGRSVFLFQDYYCYDV